MRSVYDASKTSCHYLGGGPVPQAVLKEKLFQNGTDRGNLVDVDTPAHLKLFSADMEHYVRHTMHLDYE